MEGKKEAVFRMRQLFLCLFLFLSFLALAACGGGSGSSGLQVGVFTDGPVSGLTYTGSSGSQGTTDATGRFTFLPNETITFSIGNLTLGSATGSATLTPLGIVSGATSASDQRVNNMLILLQTLDADGDLNNGIQITAAAQAIISANAASINFNQTTSAFASSLSSLMTSLNNAGVFTDTYRGTRALRSAANALSHFTRSAGGRMTVTTTYGQLRGFESPASSNFWQWVGVPYAKPPVGDLRWRPPQNPDAWTGVREATEWGDQAPQPSAYSAYGLGGVSENCLTLNITAPKNASNLPVMVWFHGGAFGILTGNTDSYNNVASLPTKGVILVTVNHRLGAFGYLASTLLTAEQGGHSGNYGQMDLIKALEWIKANIAAFGGNPNNVTIFGQSGGGGKAALLMASPLAKNLFHKVICESGIADPSNTVLNPSSLADAEAKGDNLFSRLSVTTLAQARAVPWSTIINADLAAFTTLAWLRYTPNVDGYYLTDTMANLLTSRMQSDVPILVGANSADIIAGANLGDGIRTQLPLRAANNTSAHYVYKWSYMPTGLPYGWGNLNVGAYHGVELVYVFNYPSSFVTHFAMGLPLVNGTTALTTTNIGVTASPTTNPALYGFQVLMSTGYYNPAYFATTTPLVASTESTTLTDNVLTVWTNFAKTGNPSAAGIVTSWPAYNATTNDHYVEIGSGGSFTVKSGLITTGFPASI